MGEENKKVEDTIQSIESVPTEPLEEREIETDNNGKQKKTIPPVLFVLLLLLFFGIGVFLGKVIFGGESKDKKENAEIQTNTETTNNETDTDTNISNNDIITMDINDTVVQQLFKTFDYNGSGVYLFGEKLNTDNAVRLEVASGHLDSSDRKERSCSDLKPYIDDKARYCGNMTKDMEKYYANYPENDEPFKEATKKNTTTYIEENSLVSKYNELFSSNYQYKAEDFGMMVYYNDKSLYAYYGCQCGGTYSDTITHTINSAYKIGDKLYLETVYNSIDGYNYNVKYEFILENGNYKFLKVTESKINN